VAPVQTQADIRRKARLALITRATAHTVQSVNAHPVDTERLRAYWVLGEGRQKWIHSLHRWTTLYRHLVKFMPPEEAKRTTSKWFQEAVGYASGSDLNRVRSGKPPRGRVVGPG
jgi:hypothetical protein